MTHLEKGELADLLTGRSDAVGRQRALDHLHSGCGLCQQYLRALAELLLGEEPWTAAEPVVEDQYDEAFARAGVVARSFRIRWRKEMEKLERALTLLDQAPDGLGDESFPWRQAQALHGWPLCEALLQKSYEARFSDLKRMLNLAESAVGVAKHVKSGKYPWPGFVADLRARAFAELSNAYRVNDRLSDAEMALSRAKEFLGEGTGDHVLEAQVLDLEASLRTCQRRLKDAIALLDQVHSLHMEAGDLHLAGRALISKGSNVHYQGHARESVYFVQKGLQMLDSRRDPSLEIVGRMNRLDSLVDAGEYHEAGLELLQSGLRKKLAGAPLNLLKLRWIEGKLHAGLLRPAKAGRAFMEVRSEYLGMGHVCDAALVGLELAEVWLRQGQTRDVRKLAKEVYGTFKDWGLRSEAARALYYWKSS
jgi:tetratricopeptide (TPR) repeat protein